MNSVLGAASGLVLVLAAACASSSVKHVGKSVGNAGESGGEPGESGAGGSSGRGGAAGEGDVGANGPGGVGAKGGAGGSGAKGGSDGVGCTSDFTAIDGLSFSVRLAGINDDQCCGGLPVVFHFEQTDTGLEVVLGTEGQAFRGAVTPDGERLAVEPGLRVRDYGNPYGWPMNNGVSIETLSLCFHPPRDSSPYLDGTGKLLVVSNSDDYDRQFGVDVDFTEAPWDDTPPALPPSQELDPLDPADVRVSEPLRLGALAVLDDAARTPLTPVEQAGTVVAFRISAVLPLSFQAHLGTDAKDLQGNALAPGALIRTAADPGVQALDGFESELRVVNYGTSDAELVTDARVLEGSQSLEVPGGGIALLHLMRPSAGAKYVRFDLEAAPRLVMAPASFVIRAGVVGGSVIVTQKIRATGLEGSDAAGGAAGAGGESGAGAAADGVKAVELELTEAGDDVLLEISAPFIELSASTDVGAIVDRLRIE
jgi:hypothetical protein